MSGGDRADFWKVAFQVRLRFTLSEYETLLQFIDDCRREEHFELVYVFARLFCDHAFHFCATGRRNDDSL